MEKVIDARNDVVCQVCGNPVKDSQGNILIPYSYFDDVVIQDVVIKGFKICEPCQNDDRIRTHFLKVIFIH